MLIKEKEGDAMPDADKKQPLPPMSPESKNNQANASDLADMLDYLGVERESFRKAFSATAASVLIAKQKPPTGIWLHDEQHTIVCANRQFLDQHGNCIKKRCYRKLMGKESVCRCCQSLAAFRSHAPQQCNPCNKKKPGFDINTFHLPITNTYGDRFILKSTFDLADSAAVHADRPMNEWGEWRSHHILISCSACHKIKDKEDNWVCADVKIIEHFRGRISHGICPACITVLYPYLFDSPDSTDKKSRPE
ncbi:MAG: hypothetical protein IH612_19250 [Desulfofustis sp.]|nr:hypothetical protein [Desulfofustis sp.]